ncbi:amino acid adenylation domain-containing protein [Kitasatospora sp. NPDC088134]|uniref:amino acid adenylation domain-containing protein n=1 Tax=Kitasatospora sp. NPDC088134 TaxID=3364071 RepID=UPI00380B6542
MSITTETAEPPLRRALTPAARALLNQRLRGVQAAGQVAPEIPRLAPGATAVPLSSAQQRLNFLDQLQPGSTEYLMPAVWRLSGELDRSALELALGDLVQRHPQLRTRFPSRGGVAFQEELPAGGFTPEWVDLSGVAPEARERAATAATGAAANRPFDLAAEAPFRATLVRIGAVDHVLVLAMHHIVSDAWSLGIICRDLEALYGARTGGRPAALPELPITYRDYAAWESAAGGRARAERHLDYWRTRLAGLAPLELPTDRPRPVERSHEGAVFKLTLPSRLRQSLRQLNERSSSTMFMTLLAAYQIALGFHTGQEDIAVGTIVANRDRPQTESLVGFFVNTLVMRGDLSGNPTLADYLGRVRDAALGAMDHQDVPFERLVEVLGPDRDLGRNPLFQVLFAYEYADGGGFTLGGARGESVSVGADIAKFDLSLHATEQPDGLTLSFVYRRDLFDPGTVATLADHVHRVLDAIVTRPATAIADLEPLAEEERAALLARAGNPDPVTPPTVPLLLDAFHHQVRHRPDQVAVVCADRHLTYAQLDDRAERLARVLRRRGVRPESRVGVCAGRNEWLAVAVLGIWKAGGAYLPMDGSHPGERLRFMVDDAGATLLLTDSATRDKVAGLGAEVLVLDAPGALDGAASPDRDTTPGTALRPGNAAYIIYTSGSTGRPKGVVVTHHNAARLFAACEASFDFGPDDVWSLLHSFAFDFSVWELWGALAKGGRVVIASKDVVRDPEAVFDLLATERVTVLSQTPAAFQGLRAQAAQSGRSFAELALRTVVFGGDALSARDFGDWFADPSPHRPQLVNMYGITETTVHVTHRVLTREDAEGDTLSPIGVPLTDLRGYVLDQHQRLVPIGVPGELYVAGAGLARGYLGRPSLTAERFVPDPYGPPGGRLYRTGDRVRRLPDGQLEFLGRVDAQVKIRGFRIELGEIEAALRGFPGVVDAALVVREEPGGVRRLVGHIATGAATPVDSRPVGGSPVDTRELRAHLARSLPDYMVPALITEHRTLPLTVNGKVDRKALALLQAREADLSAQYTAPRTPTEELLTGIWGKVLGLDRVGADDNFFRLGGDSILALRVIGLAREAGLALSIPDIFRAQVLADLAEVADHSTASVEAAPVAPLSMIDSAEAASLPPDVEDAYPLTMLQAGMLHELMSDPERGAYHNVTSFKLRDSAGFDLAAFQEAVDVLVERHDILRTSFDLLRDTEPLQLVHRRAALPVGFADLRGLSAAEQREAAAAHVREQAALPFDLSAAPLVRLFVHRLDEEQFRLTITDCHVVLDGWSLTSFIADLMELHHRRAAGPEPTVAAGPAVRFADYVALEREALASTASRDFWHEALVGLEPVHFAPAPGPAPVGDRPPHEAERSYRELAEPLAEVAALAGVPVRTVFLAAFHRLMGLFAGDDPYSIGMVTNGRPEHADADLMRGLFLNTVPIGFHSTARSWVEYLRETFAAERALMPHRRFPLAEMQRSLGGVAVEAVFNFVNFHRLEKDVWEDTLEVARTNFPLSLNANPGGMTLDADPRYLDATACEQLADTYRSLLRAMAAEPHGPVTRPALTGAARDLVLHRWNAATTQDRQQDPYQEEDDRRLFHELVQQHAEQHPQAPALVHGRDVTGYGELDRAGDRIARRLRALGVDTETVVGICLERGPDLARAVLGVLKSGAAYLCLDPEYPGERLAFMVGDSAMTVLLTQPELAHAAPPVRHTLMIGALTADPDPESEHLPAGCPKSGVGPDSTAYVIYTSGSTGTPKGVAVTHRGMLNLVRAQQDVLAPSPDDRVLQFASSSFDASVFEMTWALANGAQLCTAARQDLAPGADLTRTLRTQRITAAVLPPTALSVMDPQGLPDLRTLMVAGEACPAEIVDAWAPGRRFLNGYGLTETSVWVTAARCLPGGGRPSIGTPIRNTEAYVLNEDLEPVPVGAPGELCIGGLSLARGYLGRPGITAQRFVPDPFSGRSGARLFRTGDIVRHSADGSLDYVGRQDSQVKLRGFRIELGEVEDALLTHPGVRSAVAMVRADGGGDPRLVAYVVPQEAGSAPQAEELRQALRRRLPAHMVPTAYVVIDAVPLTANRKVNRRALPPVQSVRTGSAADYVAPRTPAEQALAQVWAEVLGVERVGIQDDFFALGGSSLSTVRVVAKARAQGLALTVRDLVESPTIAGIGGRRPAADPVAGPRSRVVLRPGAGQPLNCVHPTGGSVTWYLPLARALGGARPVHGYQALGLAGGTDPLTIREIAGNYVRELTADRDSGPHAILGWSMGANIALEMATQLLDAGAEVAPLVLVEPYLPTPDTHRRLVGFAEQQRHALVLRDELRAAPAGSEARTAADARLRTVLRDAGMVDEEVDLAQDAPIEVWHSLLQALAGYRARPYPGQIHLVIGQDTADRPQDTSMPDIGVPYRDYLSAWQGLAVGGLQVHHLPGGHRTMLTDPGVGNIAALLDTLTSGGRPC